MTSKTLQVRRAFTLLEVLVVVVIIAILVGIIAGAGITVLGNREKSLTEDILSTLDRALSDYMTANADEPPPWNRDLYVNVPGTGYHVTAGGDNTSDSSNAWGTINSADYPRHPDAAVFLRAAQGFGAVDSILDGLGNQWLVATPETNGSETPGDSLFNGYDGSPSVLDAWSDGNDWQAPWPALGSVTPIYYVHPSNELAQRLYGRCVNDRPYFFSAGPDRRHGSTTHEDPAGMVNATLSDQAEASLEDNIYSYEPGAADRSDAFRTSLR